MDQNINNLHPVEPSDKEVILGDNPAMEPGNNNIVTMNQKNHQITSRNFELANKNTMTMNLKIHQIKPRKITNNNLARKNMSNLTIPHINPTNLSNPMWARSIPSKTKVPNLFVCEKEEIQEQEDS